MSDTPTKSKGGFGRFIKRFSSAYPLTPPHNSHPSLPKTPELARQNQLRRGSTRPGVRGFKSGEYELRARRFGKRVPRPRSSRSSRCPKSSRASSSRAITADDPGSAWATAFGGPPLPPTSTNPPTATIHPRPLPPPLSNPSRCKVQRLGRLPPSLPVRRLLRQQPPHPDRTHLHAPPRKGT